MHHSHITPLNKLPEQLRMLRKAHKLKLKDVALVTGLAVSFLSDVECGRTWPSFETLRKLAACYHAEIVISIEAEQEQT